MDVTRIKGRRQRRRGVYRLPISKAATSKWLTGLKNDHEIKHSPTSQRRQMCWDACKADLAESEAEDEDEAPAGYSPRSNPITKCQADFEKTTSCKSEPPEGTMESSDVEPSGETNVGTKERGLIQNTANGSDIEGPAQGAVLENGDTELGKCFRVEEDFGKVNKDASLAANSKWRRAVKNGRRPRAPQRRRRRSSACRRSLKEWVPEDAAFNDDNAIPSSDTVYANIIQLFQEDVGHTTNCKGEPLESILVEPTCEDTMCGLLQSTAAENESEYPVQSEDLKHTFTQQGNSMFFVEDINIVNKDVYLHAEQGNVLKLGDLNTNGSEILMHYHDSLIEEPRQEDKTFSSESIENCIENAGDLSLDDKAYILPLSQLSDEKQELSEELLDFITAAEQRAEQNLSSENDKQLLEDFNTDFVEESAEIGEAMDDRKDIVVNLVNSIKVSNSPEPTGESCERFSTLEAQEDQPVVDNQSDSSFVGALFPDDNDLLLGYEECVVEESQCLEDFILLDEDEMQVMLTSSVDADAQPAAAGDARAALSVDGGGLEVSAESAPPSSSDLEESSMLLSESDMKLAGNVIRKAFDAMVAGPAGDAGALLHFDNVQAALDALESGGGDAIQPAAATPTTTPVVPVKMGPAVHREVERAARALFSKRTSTLYQWMYPGTPKKKLKATVTRSWDTLPDSEKMFYMSQVMGRFGTPAGSLMVNPQLAGMSTEQMETERAVAGLLASEVSRCDDWDPISVQLRSTPRKRTALHTINVGRGKKSRGAKRKLVLNKQESSDDEITPAELFAPLGI